MSNKKTSFVDKALAANDEKNPANIAKFQERVVRYADREVQTIDDKLIDAKAAIADAKASVEEVSLKVDLECINSVANINAYIPNYVSKIEDAMNKETAKSAEVTSLENRKKFFGELKKLVK